MESAPASRSPRWDPVGGDRHVTDASSRWTGEPCSTVSRALDEPRAGSAPQARLWILLEQPGPWGRDAVRESHLPTPVAHALAALGEPGQVRVGLIRSPGEHADRSPAHRTLLVARTDRGNSWVSSRVVDDLDAVGTLDAQRCLAAAMPPHDLPGRADTGVRAALLVCTNARRDRCCAVLGRPLAAQLAAQASNTSTAVWETSHTGGHRFAPTFVSLPDGYLYGGPAAAGGGVDACRGRSALPPPAQAAELAVLRATEAERPRALDVRLAADTGVWEVEVDGSVFSVHVSSRSGPRRPESCGKEDVTSSWFETELVGRA